MSTKSTVDLALSTAICASFALPQVGALVAGGLAVGQFAFDVFYPADQIDPRDLPASQQDVKDATAQIIAALNDATFTARSIDVSTFANELQTVWKELQKKPAGPNDSTWATTAANLRSKCDRLFNNIASTKDLSSAISWIEQQGVPNQMAGTYVLAVAQLIAYHKTGLAWDMNRMAEVYNEELSDYQDGITTGPLQGVKPDPLVRELMIAGNFHAQALYPNVVQGYIDTVSGMHQRWTNGFQKRSSTIAADYQTFVAQNPGLDATTLQIKWGGKLPYEYAHLTTQLGLDDITQQDVDTIGDTLKKWQDVQDDLAAAFKKAGQ